MQERVREKIKKEKKKEREKKNRKSKQTLGRTAYSSLLHLRIHQTVPVRYEAFRSAQAPANERKRGKISQSYFRTVVERFFVQFDRELDLKDGKSAQIRTQ